MRPIRLPNCWWTEEDYREMREYPTSFRHLGTIALRIVERMPQPLGQVCGPITSGGRGSILENTDIFAEAIRCLQREGKIIFDQLPFEGVMFRMLRATGGFDGLGRRVLLEEFYGRLFVSGRIRTLYFIPAWESSFGASWEYDKGQSRGIRIVHLDENFCPAISSVR